MVGQATFDMIMSYVRFFFWVFKNHPDILQQYYLEVLKDAEVQEESDVTNGV